MDEIAKMLIGTSPIAAVALLLGTSALQIWKQDLEAANVKRDAILEAVDQIKKRVSAIETKLGIQPPEQTT